MIKALEPGVILQKRYKILSLIGTGGSGFVYRVMGIILKKELALKELYDNTIEPEDKERIACQFINEARTLSKLDHPGIPKVYDAFIDEGKYYIVMDLVNGISLDQLTKNRQEFLEVRQVLDWLDQSLQILAYLHNRPDPVIVRDIKPTNIMLTPGGTIVMIDFGIAKIFDPTTGTRQYIRGSGSERFAPPEQYGTAGTDNRSDIYSLGVSLYYILTKALVPNAIDRVLHQQPVNPPSQYNPHISRNLENMIMKMVALKPEDRFQNVEEIQSYLKHINSSVHIKGSSDKLATAIPLEINIMGNDVSSPELTSNQETPSCITVPVIYCIKCGAKFADNDKFCTNCGHKRFK